MAQASARNLKALVPLAIILFVAFVVPGQSQAQEACRSLFLRSAVAPAQYVTRFAVEEALAAKIKESKAKNPLWIDTPMTELRPFVEKMIAELDKADRRMKLARTPWAIRKAVMARVSYLKMLLMAGQAAPTYRLTLKLGFRFAATISAVEIARGHQEWPGPRLLDRIEAMLMNQTFVNLTAPILEIAKNVDVVVLPTFASLSVPDMNRFWSRNILVLGFTGKTIRFDDARGAFRFTGHDYFHMQNFLQRYLNHEPNILDRIINDKAYKLALKKLNAALAYSEKVEVSILAELDGYALDAVLPHANLRVTRQQVEDAIFNTRHEDGKLLGPHHMKPNMRKFWFLDPHPDATQWLFDKHREYEDTEIDYTRRDSF